MKFNLFSTLRVLLAPVTLLAATAAAAAPDGACTLRNDNLQVTVDASGRLTSLKNRRTGQDYAGSDYLWRLYYDTPNAKEIEVLPEIGRAHV